jgi:hypothetical protein
MWYAPPVNQCAGIDSPSTRMEAVPGPVNPGVVIGPDQPDATATAAAPIISSSGICAGGPAEIAGEHVAGSSSTSSRTR